MKNHERLDAEAKEIEIPSTFPILLNWDMMLLAHVNRTEKVDHIAVLVTGKDQVIPPRLQ